MRSKPEAMGRRGGGAPALLRLALALLVLHFAAARPCPMAATAGLPICSTGHAATAGDTIPPGPADPLHPNSCDCCAFCCHLDAALTAEPAAAGIAGGWESPPQPAPVAGHHPGTPALAFRATGPPAAL